MRDGCNGGGVSGSTAGYDLIVAWGMNYDSNAVVCCILWCIAFDDILIILSNVI